MRLLLGGLLNITDMSTAAHFDATRRINIAGLNNKSKLLLWTFYCYYNFVFKGGKKASSSLMIAKNVVVFFIDKQRKRLLLFSLVIN